MDFIVIVLLFLLTLSGLFGLGYISFKVDIGELFFKRKVKRVIGTDEPTPSFLMVKDPRYAVWLKDNTYQTFLGDDPDNSYLGAYTSSISEYHLQSLLTFTEALKYLPDNKQLPTEETVLEVMKRYYEKD